MERDREGVPDIPYVEEETTELDFEKCFADFTKGEERHFSLRKQHMQRKESIHSLKKKLLIACFVLGTILGAWG